MTKKRRTTKRDHEAIKHDLIIHLTKGASWARACEKTGISRSTGYNVRRKDPSFDAEVKRILSSPLHQQRIASSKATSEAAKFNDWRRQFAIQFRLTHDRLVAAEAVGKTITEILNAMDPEHEDYDVEFATIMDDEENRRLVEVEDQAFRKAIKGDNLPAQKFLLDNLSKKYGRPKAGEKTTTNNLFWFNKSDENFALDLLSALDESAEDAKRLLQTR